MAAAASFELISWRDFSLLPVQIEAVLQFQRPEVVSLIASYAFEHLQYIVQITRKIQGGIFEDYQYNAVLFGRDSRFLMVQKMETAGEVLEISPENFTKWDANWEPFNTFSNVFSTIKMFSSTFHSLNVNTLLPNRPAQISLIKVIEHGARRDPLLGEKIDAARLPYNFCREGENTGLVEETDPDWKSSQEYDGFIRL